jgi:hypothetical protein
MAVNLRELTVIVTDVAREHSIQADVVGVLPSEGDGDYTEVVMSLVGCRAEPCRVTFGVGRGASPSELRAQVADKLVAHVRSHAEPSAPGDAGATS